MNIRGIYGKRCMPTHSEVLYVPSPINVVTDGTKYIMKRNNKGTWMGVRTNEGMVL